MIGQLLRQAEWREIGDLLAPSFFQVVSGKVLWKVGRELYGASRDERRFEAARAVRRASLAAADLPIEIASGDHVAVDTLSEAERIERGELVLALYFHEILGGDPWIFDFRYAAFDRSSKTGLAWHPKAWHADLEPGFRAHLAGVYRGFYGDDDALFRRSIQALGLSVAEQEFRAQFGGDDQRSVRFSVRTFQERFTAVFRRCREHGVSLAPEFLYLGMGLALLHEHLDALAVPLDVRGAFERAASAK